MGRIEYEYPLFKIYYSNNSNNSNIRGNPGWKFLDDKCKDENGTLLNLHLDVPQPGHFCCNDGECINSNFVGDDVTHCEGD